MATRISFSTTWPDRMGELAGKSTRFPEKILAGIMMEDGYVKHGIGDCVRVMEPAGYKCDLGIIDNRTHTHLPNGKIVPFTGGELKPNYIPKTTTIRKNYEYWKSKEGQLIQPFFWEGKPYRSKQVVFCPAVRLKRVRKVMVLYSDKGERYVNLEDDSWRSGFSVIRNEHLIPFTQHEGFDHPDHFWMWFDRDFSGAYLELESVKT